MLSTKVTFAAKKGRRLMAVTVTLKRFYQTIERKSILVCAMAAKKDLLRWAPNLEGEKKVSSSTQTIRQNHKAQRIVPTTKTKSNWKKKIILAAKDVKDNGDTFINVLLISYCQLLLLFKLLWSKQCSITFIDDDDDATCQNHIHPRSCTSLDKM